MKIDNLVIGLIVSVIFSLAGMLVIYLSYCVYHFGFGQVIIPEWQLRNIEGELPEPLRVMEAVDYWKSEAKRYAAIGGAIIFSISLVILISMCVAHAIDRWNLKEDESLN